MKLQRRLGLRVVVVTATSGLVLGVLAPPAFAAATAAFSGGTGVAVVGGTVYARVGAALTLTVSGLTTDSCLQLSGPVTNGYSVGNGTSATFSVSGAGGDAVQTESIKVFENHNTTKCTGNVSTISAAYTSDNTAPAVTGAASPVPNGAGWNRTDVTISWTASDGGSGVGSGPTPATDSVTASGLAVTRTASATDRVGNTGTGSVTVRLDEDPPTITASRTPVANGFGWNNSAVSTSFSCADALSGLSSCPSASTLSAETNGTVISGTAVDVAGNSAAASTDTIRIDTAAPSLSGASSTLPNGAGWYRGDVVIHWTATDARSGIDPATAPGDTTLAGEGAAVTATASVSDKAGNTTSATSPTVRIDRTAPATSLSGVSNGWVNGTVTGTLSATDNLSGVASTSYQVDSGPMQSGTSFTIGTEGDHSVSYASTDVAGNVEPTRTAHVRIDKTAPTLSHAFLPGSYVDGDWSNAPTVTVTWTCQDQGGSGVASCPAAVPVSAEGASAVVRSAADGAGNSSASDTATVRLDHTPPSITALPDRAPNGNGWYAADVTVGFTCLDQSGLSGVASCPAAATAGEGAAQSVSGTAYDRAGNSASTSLTGLNVDKTAPTVAGTLVGTPSGGWYRNDVGVHWTCNDALSGLEGTCPPDSTITGEGASLGATTSVRDLAGNVGVGAVSGVRIDRTAPVTAAAVSPNAPANGWYADPPTLTLTGSDALSGVAATWYAIDGGAPQAYAGPFSLTSRGTHLLTFWSRDVAGNLEDVTSPGHTLQVKLDGTPPTISGTRAPAANAFGWNNADVTVAFHCDDAESGIAGCTPDTTVSAEGADQHVDGTAVDHAGNSASARVEHISVDKTPPGLSGAPTSSPNGAGWYTDDVTVAWTASDALSGIDAGTAPAPSVVTGEGNALSTGPVSVSDQAGNSTTTSYDGLHIDRTAPSLTASYPAPNADGWYRLPVPVTWSCSDALSGIAPGTCPAPATVAGEGEDLGTSAGVHDVAGNLKTTTVTGLHLDQTPPVTTVAAPADWVNHSATAVLTATDGLSGLAATHYSVNGGSEQTGTAVTFTAEGSYDLEFWSVDLAGNVETPQHALVRIDLTAPAVHHALSPEPNAAGWNRAPVTVTFTCTDAGGSGIASCPPPRTETHDGRAIEVAGTAYDNAGNSTEDVTTVSIDMLPPTVVASPDRAPNAVHWYDAPVTVAFSCADQPLLSGVDSCPSPVTLTEGAEQSLSGTARDVAGNEATATLAHLNVDTTAPTLTGAPTTSPNAAGWYRGDVTVHWTCGDVLSGLAATCPDDSVVTGAGADLGATETIADVAGNTTPASVSGLHIDRTAPTTTPSLPHAVTPDGWYAVAPLVTLTAADSLSGVESTYYALDGGAPVLYAGPFSEGAEGMHVLSWWSLDHAGNVEDVQTRSVGVDATAPVITGHRSAPDGDAGWAVTPVLVTFTCSDPDGSGVDSCPAPTTLLGDGAGQSVTGTATDRVGNTASATVADVDVDQAAPTLVPHYAAPNAGGWYRDDVTVGWTCTDATSGVPAGTCPADTAVTGEGSDVTLTEHVRDTAGNLTSDTVHLKIDRHAPLTGISPVSDWTNAAVHLDLTPGEDLSGVAGTFFTVDAGSEQSGRVVDIASEGVHDLSWWSVDNAGNVEPAHHVQVRIDRSAPTIGHALSPAPNGAGWNHEPVTVTFLCGDALSGVASCTPPDTVSTQGAGQTRTGTAVDRAGNHASDTATVNVDTDPPTITGSAARPPDVRGWYDAPVAVSFQCDDVLSGIASCSAPRTVGQGVAQAVDGSAVDRADNAASTTVTGLDVDLTPPTISGGPTTAANGSGWYHSDVVVHFTCGDALSGVHACPADTTLTGEGDSLMVPGTAEDVAGNTAGRSVGPIRIDRQPPTSSEAHTASPYGSGWYADPVPVTLSAFDGLSGVASTSYRVDGGPVTAYSAPVVMGRGTHVLTWWSTDVAGNAEAPHSLTVRVDDGAPTISGAPDRAPNSAGWYGAPVTVAFSCGDAETVVASCGPGAVLGEGAGQHVTGSAVDAAGNRSSATVGPLNVDLTKPVIAAYTGATVMVLGQPVSPPTCALASDALSGIASCAVSVSGDPTRVGDTTYTLAAADRAGNVATLRVTVHVGYVFSGFLQPVTGTAHDQGSASTFKAGSTVPLKFDLRDASGALVNVRTLPSVLSPVDLGLTASGSTLTDPGTATTSGASYTFDGSHYQYNWQTPKSGAGHCFRVSVRLDSGDVQWVLIKLS